VLLNRHRSCAEACQKIHTYIEKDLQKRPINVCVKICMNKMTCIYLCRVLLNEQLNWSDADVYQTRHTRTYIKKRPTTEIYEQIHTNMYVYATNKHVCICNRDLFMYIHVCMNMHIYIFKSNLKPKTCPCASARTRFLIR